MRYQVTLDGHKVDVEVLEREGRRYAVVGGREHALDFRHVRGGNCYSLILGEKSCPVSFERRPDGLSVTVESEYYLARVEDERTLAARRAGGGRRHGDGPRVVYSMMPGIVREVRVHPGDAVKAGQPLLILEAMKMQNEIRAAADGKVKSVHAQAGTTVNKGDPLITLEA